MWIVFSEEDDVDSIFLFMWTVGNFNLTYIVFFKLIRKVSIFTLLKLVVKRWCEQYLSVDLNGMFKMSSV